MKLENKFLDEIYYFTEIVDNPKEFLQNVDEIKLPWKEWAASGDKNTIYGSKKTLHPEDLDSLEGSEKDHALAVHNTVLNIIKNIYEYVSNDKSISDHTIHSTEVAFSKYISDSYMGIHCDAMDQDSNLKYSIVIYWNDDYEGGEISFFMTDKDLRLKENEHLRLSPDRDLDEIIDKLDLVIKPKTASAIVFPSSPPFYHQVHMIKSGYRYMTAAFILEK